MATIKKFEELEIWQSARKLNAEICPVLESLQETRNYKLKEQLDGSVGSVMDNIAEGFERDGNREFLQFLAISKGSLGEARSQLYRAFDRKALNENELNNFQVKCGELAGKISNSCFI
jgi:four helix bundle protein